MLFIFYILVCLFTFINMKPSETRHEKIISVVVAINWPVYYILMINYYKEELVSSLRETLGIHFELKAVDEFPGIIQDNEQNVINVRER